jgi:hypothetical protein
MNNISEKNDMISWFIQGMLAFAVWIILMFIQPGGFLVVFMFLLPIFFLISLITSILTLSHADINIDEAGNVLIVTTLFNEKQLPLNNFEIKGYDIPGTGEFILYTNTKEIVIFRNIKNYNEIVKLFEYKKYKYNKAFHADLLKFISKWGLAILPGSTFETYEKIKMRAGMNDV